MANLKKEEKIVVTFTTNDFNRLKREYPNFFNNYSTFRQWAKSFIDDIKATAGTFCKVSSKRMTNAPEKIYLLVEEMNWNNVEEYKEVIKAYRDKKEAISDLQMYRGTFIMGHEEDWNDAKEKPDMWTIQDTPEHFQMLDEGMGYNYELMVKEEYLV